jgi:hypothetical protein
MSDSDSDSGEMVTHTISTCNKFHKKADILAKLDILFASCFGDKFQPNELCPIQMLNGIGMSSVHSRLQRETMRNKLNKMADERDVMIEVIKTLNNTLEEEVNRRKDFNTKYKNIPQKDWDFLVDQVSKTCEYNLEDCLEAINKEKIYQGYSETK